MNLKDYDKIKIPENLNEYIDKGINKGINYKGKNNTFKKVAAIVLVSGATLVTASNVPVFSNELVKIPIIGPVVKILDFRHKVQYGGIITDGNGLIIDSLEKDTINIYFNNEGEFINNSPRYEIEYRKYPNTMVFTFDGIREIDQKYLEENKEKLPFVKAVYRIITLDDSRCRIAIEFEENVSFKISEHENPGMIGIKVEKNIEKATDKSAYFIRTMEFDNGEQIAQMEEFLYPYEDIQIQRVSENRYIFQLGPYENKEEANKQLEILSKDESLPLYFYLEMRELGQGPKNE